jgi:protein-tyrosine phosphatase
MQHMPKNILMVCLGNICRSPLAEGLFRHHVALRGLEEQYRIDSCGTGGWHIGESPHDGSIDIAQRHGIDISGQRSRQVRSDEIGDWDWIIAMDSSNHTNLLRLGSDPERTRLLLGFIPPGYKRDVPDPYYEGGFDRVYDLVDEGCRCLLDFIEDDGR